MLLHCIWQLSLLLPCLSHNLMLKISRAVTCEVRTVVALQLYLHSFPVFISATAVTTDFFSGVSESFFYDRSASARLLPWFAIASCLASADHLVTRMVAHNFLLWITTRDCDYHPGDVVLCLLFLRATDGVSRFWPSDSLSDQVTFKYRAFSNYKKLQSLSFASCLDIHCVIIRWSFRYFVA
jgi:hypothetical protein